MSPVRRNLIVGGPMGTVSAWLSDLESTLRWWLTFQVWRPPTRRQHARPIGDRPWPLPQRRGLSR